MAKKYSDIELAALIGEVREEVSGLFKSEGAALRKDGQFPPEESSPDASASAGAPPDASASASPAPDASAASPDASADPAAGAAPAPDASSGGDPVQALQQAYAQLSPEELQAHKMALDAVMMAQQPQAGAPGMDPAAGAGMPPADPAMAGAPPAGAPPAGGNAPMAGEGSKPVDPAAMMAMKSEKTDRAVALVKKEADEAKAELAEVKKSMEAVTKAFELILKKPVRQAITGKDVMAKSEPNADLSKLSKAEITTKLNRVTRNPKLEKSDRDLVNDFYSNKVNVDAIAHLLNK